MTNSIHARLDIIQTVFTKSTSINTFPIHIAPSAAPVSVTSSVVNSSGFTLMWDAPPTEDQNGVIRYYAIHIIEINTSQEHTLNSTGTQTAVYFLHPYYNYTYAVSAVTIQLGPYTNATNIRTSEDGMKKLLHAFNTFMYSDCCSLHSAPTGPPLNVDATPVNSTSVTISWNPPALENQNGVITGYVINLTLTVGSGDISQYSSSSDNITVGSLHPFTTYDFTVAAQTSVGTGPYTTSSTVMTPEDGIYSITDLVKTDAVMVSPLTSVSFYFFSTLIGPCCY